MFTDNRFAILRPKESAPGTQEERERTLPLDPSFRCEGPIALHPRMDIVPTSQASSSEKLKDKSLASSSRAIPYSKRASIPTLAPHSPSKSISIEPDQQPSAPTAASIWPTKPQPQSSPLVLQVGAQSARSSRTSPKSTRVSPDFDTAAPHLSLLAPQSAPTLPSPPMPQSPPPSPPPSPPLAALPSPPIPQDPMSIPSLATLPIHPSLDFRSLTSPKYTGPKPRQFMPPIPTSSDIFRSDDPMGHIVQKRSGKFFSFAAEIAAANEKSKMRPVGNVLVPGPAKKFGEIKEKIDREKLDPRSGEYVTSPEQMEDESEEEGGEGDEWLGKDERFWEQPFEEGTVVKMRRRTRKEEMVHEG